MTYSSLRLRCGVPTAVLTTALLMLPSSLRAADQRITGSDTQSTTLLLTQADAFKKAGDWYNACLWYNFCLEKNRNQPEIKKKFLECLRNYYRVYRHSDPSFRQQILGPDFRLVQAMSFYEEVLAKLQKNYVDPDKVTLGRLYREGITELHMGLKDESFVNLYVPEARRGKVAGFLEVLKKRQADTAEFTTPAVAGREAARLSREAADVLGMDRRIVLVEFACGACNALDEWTFYASPGALYGGREEKSVFFADKYQDYLKQGIGILRITHFQDGTVQEMETALETLKAQGMQVLILDLRNNRGGSVDVAVDVVRRFLPDGTEIASTSGKVNMPYQSYTMAPLSLPVFVLVDGSTASAAELVAGAFKAHKRAELVGQTTYGKNWIQQTMSVNQAPHGAICITWAQFFVPNTTDLSKGIAPTIPVSAVGAGDRDPTREVAVERARTFVAVMR